MPDQDIIAVNPTTGKKVKWDGKAWTPYVEPPQAGDFTRGFSDSMGFSSPNISFGKMAKETWQNTKKGVGNEYERLQEMTGEKGHPLMGRGFSEVLLPFGVIASGIEGVASGLEKGGKDLLTPGKRKYGGGELLASLGQLFMGKEATEKVGAATDAVKAGAKSTGEGVLREAMGVPERTIEKARAEHVEKMSNINLENLQKQNTLNAEYEKSLREAEKEHQQAVNETEGSNLQKEAAHKLKVEQIKEKHAAAQAAREQVYREKVSAANRVHENEVSAFNRPGAETQSGKATRAEVKRKSLTTQPRSGPVYQRIAGMADKIGESIPKLTQNVRSAYNARWSAWRQAMGEAEGNFSDVQKAVQEAEQSILKGSPESIAIFKNILKEGENPLFEDILVSKDAKGIQVKPGTATKGMSEATRSSVLKALEDAGIPGDSVIQEGTRLPIDDIRGYKTELQQKMMSGRFQGDVYRALNHVLDTANKEIERVAQEKGQLPAYKQLNSDWSQFMNDFYESDGALAKLRNSVNSDTRINLLKGAEGARVIEAMGRYAKFNPDIESVGRLRSLMKQIQELPSSGAAPEGPNIPARPAPLAEPQIPAAPTTKPIPEFQPPVKPEFTPKDVTPFDLPEFVKTAVTKRAEKFGIAGHTLIGYWIIRDIFHGEMPSPAMLAAPLVQNAIRRYLTSPKFIDRITRMVQ